MDLEKEALEYHEKPVHGKIEVVATKPCITQYDLSLAYTPGVAKPCLKIEENPEDVYKYTSKGNLVAVVSNGTAVLGLGNIGAAAGKPVMEGKGVLFKQFADIDVFDIELDTQNPDEIINIVEKLEPTFGGINLEDIKAPECFYIENELKKRMNIPVFHDDQHGTAIISAAALLNACELQGKKLSDVKIVVNGAGAAAYSCARHYENVGASHENIFMCDSKGVITSKRPKEQLNQFKEYFIQETEAVTLEDIMKGADVFIGLSVADTLTQDMVRSMADKPVILAMANPNPEIDYNLAMETRSDLIMGTGRSDYPNQVNNVLGFPFIFRGALDVQASEINDEMKVAATMALANLAKEDVPDEVAQAYGGERLSFGPKYIIPKPFDPRVLVHESAAVAETAMKTGVARKPIDIEEYKRALEVRLERSRSLMRELWDKAKVHPKRIVYPEGRNEKILRAAAIIVEEKIAEPILLGKQEEIEANAKELGIDLSKMTIIDPKRYHKKEKYIQEYYNLRQRKGVTYYDASRQIHNRTVFASMMVHVGDADGMVGGVTQHYHDTLKPALQIIGHSQETSTVAGMFIMVFKDSVKFLADTTVNVSPSAQELADIALLSAKEARKFNVKPKIAMLSYSNFGAARDECASKSAQAVKIVREKDPDLMIDGEMNADVALNTKIRKETFPFSGLKENANVLIFPNLQSGNIAYKLLGELSEVEVIGPILMGMKKPVHLLQIGSSSAKDVVNMTAYAVVDASI